MLPGRKIRGTTHLTAKTAVTSRTLTSPQPVTGRPDSITEAESLFTKPAPETVSFRSCTVSQLSTAL